MVTRWRRTHAKKTRRDWTQVIQAIQSVKNEEEHQAVEKEFKNLCKDQTAPQTRKDYSLLRERSVPIIPVSRLFVKPLSRLLKPNGPDYSSSKLWGQKQSEKKKQVKIGGKCRRRNPCGTEKDPDKFDSLEVRDERRKKRPDKMPRDHRPRGDRPPREPRQDVTEHHEKIAHDEAFDTVVKKKETRTKIKNSSIKIKNKKKIMIIITFWKLFSRSFLKGRLIDIDGNTLYTHLYHVLTRFPSDA